MSSRTQLAGPSQLRRHAPLLSLLGITLFTYAGLFLLHLSAWQLLLAVVGIVMVLVFIAKPFLAYCAFVSTFTIEYLLGVSDVFTATKLIGLLAVFAWMLDAVTARRYAIPRTIVLALGPMFLVCAVISLLVAEDVEAGLERLTTILLLNVLMILTATILQTKRRVELVGWIMVFSALLPVVFIFREVGPQGTVNDQEFLYNRNAMALFLAISVPFIFYFYRRVRAPMKVLLASLAGLFAVSVSLSLSRGGFVAFIVALLLSWFLVIRGQRLRVLIIFGALIASVSLVLPDVVWDRMGSIVPAVLEGRDTMGMRYELWRINLAMIRDHFWLGVGPGNYYHYYMQYSGVMGLKRNPLPAHNTFLEVMVEVGAVGVTAFLLLFAAAIRTLWTARKIAIRERRRDLADLSACVLIALAVFGVGGLKGGVQFYKHLWCFFGASASLWAMVQGKRLYTPEEAAPPAREPS